MAIIDPINHIDDLKNNSKKVLDELKETIDGLNFKKAKLLLFWLDTWGRRYLKEEDTFDYMSLIEYKRGSIVQVNLGFKVGSEQGGLHYALVIENENSKLNKVITVLPLRSLKNKEDLNAIDKKYEVYLGKSLFEDEIKKLESSISMINEFIEQNKEKDNSSLLKDMTHLQKKLKDYNKGTVAMLSQICALSKLRIYTPKTSVHDELYSFKLSDEKLDEIDDKIRELYLKPQNKKVLTHQK